MVGGWVFHQKASCGTSGRKAQDTARATSAPATRRTDCPVRATQCHAGARATETGATNERQSGQTKPGLPEGGGGGDPGPFPSGSENQEKCELTATHRKVNMPTPLSAEGSVCVRTQVIGTSHT